MLLNEPLYTVGDRTENGELRRQVLGHTNRGRLLCVVYTVTNDGLIRVVTAYPMNDKQKRLYLSLKSEEK